MDKSIAYWDKAIAYYRQVGDVQQVGRMLIEQSQIYNSFGQSRKAIAVNGIAHEFDYQSVFINRVANAQPGSSLDSQRPGLEVREGKTLALLS
ncbi:MULTISPECIES: hypothetical protein [Nostocales]|uniref:Uncharacterized protein n=3 Tax=Nostocales TaxID=1161 RepID=A0A0C1RDG7_9CYAN|nr:hypothetical protein [Tolypothrix bouteillei]KAF3884333.1 hypothetical protein DA73_0400001665 [Tolypothrix bouteillei VB521301]